LHKISAENCISKKNNTLIFETEIIQNHIYTTKETLRMTFNMSMSIFEGCPMIYSAHSISI